MIKSRPFQQKTSKVSTQGKVSTDCAGYLAPTPPHPSTQTPQLQSDSEDTLKLENMAFENDADLKRLEEELRREKERVARLEREVKEKMRQQAEKNAAARRQGR